MPDDAKLNRQPALELPIPHIWDDGLVTTLTLKRMEFESNFSLSDGVGDIIIIGDADHARALARALTIAANHLDNNPDR